MTNTAAPEAPAGTIRCGSCHDRHASAEDVRRCYTDARGGFFTDADFDDNQAAEIYAEDAWLRAAEAGTPETWEEENRDRMIEACGYGPPPGF